MKMKNILTLLALLSLPSCVPDFFKVVSSSYAKELCSCLFVVGLDENYCKNYAKQIVSVSKLKISREKKFIVAEGLGHKSLAIYQSQKLGCLLEGEDLNEENMSAMR